jgi:hypothetical protein
MTIPGRPAALPPTSYRSPVRREDRASDPMRVSVFPEHGRYAMEFDFTALPVSEPMRRWLVDRFVAVTGPSGNYRTEHSTRMVMTAIRSFTTYLGSLEHPPETPRGFRGSHWDGWVLTVPMGSRRSQLAVIRTLTKGCAEIPPDFFARAQRTRVPTHSAKLPSYSPEEFTRITVLAKSGLREAVHRIREGRALLSDWRAGQIDRIADAHRWEHGFLLDFLDVHGHVPRYPCGRAHRTLPEYGGSEALFARLYPTLWDMSAAAVLLVCLTGHNLSAVLSLPADGHRPDGDSDGRHTVLVDMLKPRRGR